MKIVVCSCTWCTMHEKVNHGQLMLSWNTVPYLVQRKLSVNGLHTPIWWSRRLKIVSLAHLLKRPLNNKRWLMLGIVISHFPHENIEITSKAVRHKWLMSSLEFRFLPSGIASMHRCLFRRKSETEAPLCHSWPENQGAAASGLCPGLPTRFLSFHQSSSRALGWGLKLAFVILKNIASKLEL